MTEENLSFLPEDYVERRIEQRTNIICLTLFVIVLGGIGAAYMMTTQQRREVRAEAANVDAAYSEAADRLAQLDELQQRREQMLRQAQVASTLIEPVPRTFLLADLINRMPPTLSLFNLELDSQLINHSPGRRIGPTSAFATRSEDDEENAPPPVPRYRISLVLTGVAPTDVQVAQYMASLAESDLAEDVNLVYSERTQLHNTNMRQFRIEMTLDPGADVRQLDPLRFDRQIARDPLREPSLSQERLLQQQAVESTGELATDSDVPDVDLSEIEDAEAGDSTADGLDSARDLLQNVIPRD